MRASVLFELGTLVVMILVIVSVHVLLRRLGSRYVARLFTNSPGAGRSFLALGDVAYYLIFLSYAFFTTSFDSLSGETFTDQAQRSVNKLAGLMLIMGVMHGLNLLLLPVLAKLVPTSHDDPESPQS